MPSKSYSLEPDGRPRLEVTWQGAYNEVTLTVDGTVIESGVDAAELATPRRYALADGSSLEVTLVKVGPFPELHLSRDGEPLPGSAADPEARLDGAVNTLYAIGLLNAIFGVVAAVLGIEALTKLGIGWPSVLAGAVYAGLGALVRKRLTIALGLAVVLFVCDGVYTLIVASAGEGSPPVGGFLVRLFLLLPMVRGFGAIRTLNAPRKPRPVRRPATAPLRPRPTGPTSAGAPPAASATGPGAPPSPSPAKPAPPIAKTLTGDAERLRLQMTEKNTGPSRISISGRRVEGRGASGADAASKSLRFVLHKLEIGDQGLRGSFSDGSTREVPFAQITRVAARQLPPDPPWEGALFLDIASSVDGGAGPMRVFGTTTVNYAAIPGGATSSRLDNTRRFAGFLKERAAGAHFDEGTLEFIKGPKVPPRFANMTQFIEYDATCL